MRQRFEGKLTGQITPKHTLVGSYLDVDSATRATTVFGHVVDLRSLSYRETAEQRSGPSTTTASSPNNLLLEAQYSEMDSRSPRRPNTRDLIEGTLLLDTATRYRGWSPTFCGICRYKERNNKSGWSRPPTSSPRRRSASTASSAAIEEFHQLRNENNFQSGSDFRI